MEKHVYSEAVGDYMLMRQADVEAQKEMEKSQTSHHLRSIEDEDNETIENYVLMRRTDVEKERAQTSPRAQQCSIEEVSESSKNDPGDDTSVKEVSKPDKTKEDQETIYQVPSIKPKPLLKQEQKPLVPAKRKLMGLIKRFEDEYSEMDQSKPPHVQLQKSSSTVKEKLQTLEEQNTGSCDPHHSTDESPYQLPCGWTKTNQTTIYQPLVDVKEKSSSSPAPSAEDGAPLIPPETEPDHDQVGNDKLLQSNKSTAHQERAPQSPYALIKPRSSLRLVNSPKLNMSENEEVLNQQDGEKAFMNRPRTLPRKSKLRNVTNAGNDSSPLQVKKTKEQHEIVHRSSLSPPTVDQSVPLKHADPPTNLGQPYETHSEQNVTLPKGLVSQKCSDSKLAEELSPLTGLSKEPNTVKHSPDDDQKGFKSYTYMQLKQKPKTLPRNWGKQRGSPVTPRKAAWSPFTNEETHGKIAQRNEYVKSNGQPYTLENFIDIHPLPQLVSVTEGYYGMTSDFSMSEGMEIILFFKKKTEAVVAQARGIEYKYYIPLSCSMMFAPYQRDSIEHLTKSYHYQRVEDLLKRKDGLPKVVKVLKARRTKPALNANELIFPKGLSSKKGCLKFTDIRNEEIRLEFNCDIGFSTHPSDIKMYLTDYIDHLNEFPSSVVVFNDDEDSELLYNIHTGTEIILQEHKILYSCICSTDLHGEMNYPLMELLATLPIKVKAIDSPVEPLYDTVKKVYENFNLSMVVQNSMFLAQDDTHIYDEIRTDSNYLTTTKHFYDLEVPAGAYTGFGSLPSTPPNMQKKKINTLPLPKLPHPLKPPISSLTPPSSLQALQRFQHKKSPGPDENRSYLRSFSIADVLQLLDTMKLTHFKDVFAINGIDGKTLLSLTKLELQSLGIRDQKTQKKLLGVINGQKAIYKN